MTIVSTPYPVAPASLEESTDLHKIAGRISNSFLPVAVRNSSFFINDIPEDLYINSNPHLVAFILGGLLSSVVSHVKDSCIRISAKVYSHVILIHVKDCSSSIHSSSVNEVKQLQSLAEKLGGFVSLTSQRHHATTFAFSFPNLPMAA